MGVAIMGVEIGGMALLARNVGEGRKITLKYAYILYIWD